MGALVLAGAVTVGLSDPAVEDAVEDLIYNTNMLSGSGFGPADTLAGLLWGVSLFYASPLQQLLLFLGKIETQRPSDWIIMVLARGPLGLPITDVNEAPGWLSGVAAGVCLVSGLAISAVLQAGLGDSIWALSTGTGACLAAGVYEVGRPKRMNRAEAQELDEQWRDFVGWANGRLVRSGRCHESEIQTAFRKQFPRYRSQDALTDATLRSLVRNWAPEVDRTPNGFYRGVSLRPRVNEFTGQVEGGSGASTPVASRDPSPTSSVDGEPVATAAGGGAQQP
ncbi:hypothetical protein CHLRE_14g610850v5 [Chlamydomonas reinhardtii]|uniref:Uncharacterized protein n=1 Tax=Chlamydomonas reinhardtii TaxID=3055 RepID=A0A2K3CXC0_CHLRE|nr:uncharacterized protein CHLRE_14g610850v5 [Chlamydomonas reinhardtii]PNW72899.1 hypothetical protein CHLRE_14g610850v5 [Chlamydomonas reinhardtii]